MQKQTPEKEKKKRNEYRYFQYGPFVLKRSGKERGGRCGVIVGHLQVCGGDQILARMGGGHGGAADGSYPDIRTKVWSLTGGPFCRPKYWRRNTAIAMAGIFLVCIPIAIKSAKLEQRPNYPVRPIPSQKWCKNFPNPE